MPNIAGLPGMFERTLSCSSLSKTYAITGWRLGCVIAPEQVTAGVRKVHVFLTVGAPPGKGCSGYAKRQRPTRRAGEGE